MSINHTSHQLIEIICSFHRPSRFLAVVLPQAFISLGGGFFSFRDKMIYEQDNHRREILFHAYSSYMQMKGFFIGDAAKISSPPVFPHGLHGVYISTGAIIGKDCVIFPNVVIGSNMLRDSISMGAPVVGDSCYIGAGATLIGNISIGNNCRIGANTTVTENIPDNCVVVNQKPRIIQKKNLDNSWRPFPG